MVDRGRVAFGLTVLACAWFAALVPAAALVPSGTQETASSAGVITRSSTTLVGDQGLWVLALFAIPLVLGMVCWVGLRRRCTGRVAWERAFVWLPVGAVVAFSLISAASIGLFILPGAFALAAAAAVTPVGSR